jgi:glycosyltransferase involved in cell wall biosynthesis
VAARGPVLMLVENMPVPTDRRVWPECRALHEAGYEVVVVCPQGAEVDAAPLEVVDGVEIHRFPAMPGHGPLSFVREYASAFWHVYRLVRRLGRRRAFAVVHAANPPDYLLLAALPLKRRGASFVFDHHDLFPELYLSRFGHSKNLVYRLALALERLSFRLADVVVSTNESYRRIAIERGGKRPEEVFVVRNAPDVERFRPGEPAPELRRGMKHLLAYVGVMAPQDGVDGAVRALRLLRDRRDDWHAIFAGDGDAYEEVRELATRLGLDDVVEFTGYLHDEAAVRRILATADVCLAPEPKGPLNDASTLIKIGEYMAAERPVVSFDLHESRITAGGAALYAEPNDESSFAARIAELLDDPDRRRRMGELGRQRVERLYSWEHSKAALLAAYERAVSSGDGQTP